MWKIAVGPALLNSAPISSFFAPRSSGSAPESRAARLRSGRERPDTLALRVPLHKERGCFWTSLHFVVSGSLSGVRLLEPNSRRHELIGRHSARQDYPVVQSMNRGTAPKPEAPAAHPTYRLSRNGHEFHGRITGSRAGIATRGVQVITAACLAAAGAFDAIP